MFQVNHLVGFGAGASSRDPTVVYASTAVQNGSLTSPHTFSAQGIGTASSDRVVLVSIYAKGSGVPVDSITIGGVSAAKLVEITHNEGNATIWALKVAAGTTADIALTWTGTLDRVFIGVHAMTGTSGSASAHDTATHSATTSLTTTIDVPSGGAVVAVCGGNNTGGVTFTAGITEEWEQIATASAGGASDDDLSLESGRTISATVPSAHECLAVVSF